MAASLAAFDFDGTLSRGDALLSFLHHRLGGPGLAALACRAILPVVWFGVLGQRTGVKEALLRAGLNGLLERDLAAQAEGFARAVLLRRLKPAALATLSAHLGAGHRVAIVSASPEILLRPVARALGVELVASRLDVAHGRITGKLDGASCWGPEKLRRLQDHVGGPFRLIAAYGDGRGDRELLAAAENPFFRRFPTRISI